MRYIGLFCTIGPFTTTAVVHLVPLHQSHVVAASAKASEGSITSNSSRRLSFEIIAGYEPFTQVTDQLVIDLDQFTIEQQLALNTEESFQTAQRVYQEGGHSRTIARLTLSSPLPVALSKGTELVGTGTNGQQVMGSAFTDMAAGSTSIDFRYKTNDLNADNCQVGGLPEPNVDGCLEPSGTVQVSGLDLDYTYAPLLDNVSTRTIQGFSTSARMQMYECENFCPYPDYAKFVDYYGVFDYANEWILAAFAGASTSFNLGNADFGSYGLTGRAEAISGGTVYMAIWMYVIGQMEDALDDCQKDCLLCNDDPVSSWDVAVAYYTGSLEGQDGSGDGNLLYALADKRCQNFRTCGENGRNTEGTSKVKRDIFAQFATGRANLLNRDCAAARENKNRIVQLMVIPLIQGTLRYAYLKDTSTTTNVSSSEKSESEGAVFAAAVLPIVHWCSEDDAEVIYGNMRVGSGVSDFFVVKESFENNYACMGITCLDVGGLFDESTGSYFANAAPCNDESTSSSAPTIFPTVENTAVVSTPLFPTAAPTDTSTASEQPSSVPSTSPTGLLSTSPSASPTVSLSPTSPAVLPSLSPSSSPSVSLSPTASPSVSLSPTTLPSFSPSSSPSASMGPTTSLNPSTSPTAPLLSCTECACDLCDGKALRVSNNGTVIASNIPGQQQSSAATCDLWAIVACTTTGATCLELQTGVVAKECCTTSSSRTAKTQRDSSGAAITITSFAVGVAFMPILACFNIF